MGSAEHAAVKGLVVVRRKKKTIYVVAPCRHVLHWHQRWRLRHLPSQITQLRARRCTMLLVRRALFEVEVTQLHISSVNEQMNKYIHS